MTKKHDPVARPESEPVPAPPAEPVPPHSAAEDAGVEPPALVELPEAAAERLETELDAIKDRELRLRAEYDNFRKRVARERTETAVRAQAEVLVKLVDALDDLGRFAHVDPATTDAKTLHEGIELVERKLLKQLELLGLTRIDQTGVPFDPQRHEAVTTQPAPAAEQDHTVGAVLSPGYLLRETLVRPARVVVLTWTAPPGGEIA